MKNSHPHWFLLSVRFEKVCNTVGRSIPNYSIAVGGGRSLDRVDLTASTSRTSFKPPLWHSRFFVRILCAIKHLTTTHTHDFAIVHAINASLLVLVSSQLSQLFCWHFFASKLTWYFSLYSTSTILVMDRAYHSVTSPYHTVNTTRTACEWSIFHTAARLISRVASSWRS